MPSVQGIYYYFYAFYRWHNHISFKVMLHSGIPKCKTSYLLWLFHSFAVTLQTVSKMEAKGGAVSVDTAEIIPAEPDTGNADAGIGKTSFL